MAEFAYSPMFPLAADTTEYELVTSDHVKLVEIDGEQFLRVAPEGLTELAERAFTDISHLLRSSHLAQLAAILDDPEATKNDRFVAMEMLKNAVISAEGQLPMCQDTGTALVTGYRGDHVLVSGDDGEALSRGIYNTYQNCNLRFSITKLSEPMFTISPIGTHFNMSLYIDLLAKERFKLLSRGNSKLFKTRPLFANDNSLL